MSKKSNLPNDADAYYDRGVAKGGQGDYRGALADLDRAIALKPDNAGSLLLSGECQVRAERPRRRHSGL